MGTLPTNAAMCKGPEPPFVPGHEGTQAAAKQMTGAKAGGEKAAEEEAAKKVRTGSGVFGLAPLSRDI